MGTYFDPQCALSCIGHVRNSVGKPGTAFDASPSLALGHLAHLARPERLGCATFWRFGPTKRRFLRLHRYGSRGSCPMLLNHGSFQKPAVSPGSDGFLEGRIPGKNGEVSPRMVGTYTGLNRASNQRP